eukprot:CAMPEP_0206258978 /NCGR_PEP_ID=MMETSP0047_2-20121206/26226_1 /ASSEMBLY_ACC=CAM_ASM_000192 /TAXON_ID=195065 /ORGANISM="Chroomonas mesostigmatica_cf, Strain CCMP1168" /LENGTH=82 /DNA_ID=CAMNT_0053685795 /DNA_START=113 /DNA_END=358 /DNA_ORIENTATION=+
MVSLSRRSSLFLRLAVRVSESLSEKPSFPELVVILQYSPSATRTYICVSMKHSIKAHAVSAESTFRAMLDSRREYFSFNSAL